MNYRQPGMRRSVEGSMRLGLRAAPCPSHRGPAGWRCAGEFDRSIFPAATADPAPCGGHGAGAGLRKSSADCRRISGYIAAGARFGSDDAIGGRPSPFGHARCTGIRWRGQGGRRGAYRRAGGGPPPHLPLARPPATRRADFEIRSFVVPLRPKTPPRRRPDRPTGPTGLRSARSNAAPTPGRSPRSLRADAAGSSRPRPAH